MSEATQTATSTDARQASMSRVSTQETVLAKLIPTEAAKVPPEVKTEGEPNKDEGKDKQKKSANERIQELVAQRTAQEQARLDAEARAERAERKQQELEEKLNAQSVQAKPIESNPRPQRAQFATEDDYIDAVTDWKADQRIAKREAEQEQARVEAAQREVEAKWEKRQQKAMAEFSDYNEVVGKADTEIPGYLVVAMKKSTVGPQALYYLCLHTDEAKSYSSLDPIDGIKRFRDLERDLSELEDEPTSQTSKPAAPKVEKSKAPPPIETIKSAPSSGGSSNSFEEYKRRREAEKRK